MLVNDIEYVKTNILSSLPQLLNFSDVIMKMVDSYGSTGFESTHITLTRLIKTTEDRMNEVIALIFENVAKSFYESLKVKIRNYYHDEKRARANVRKRQEKTLIFVVF